MSTRVQVASFHAGKVRVDRPARVVLVDGKPAKLGGRAFDLLDTLMQHRDRVVPKQELLDLVWPGLVVEENNLQVHVMSLRKLLGVDAIRTVSGRGYQFTLIEDLVAVDSTGVGERRAENEPGPTTALVGRDELIASACALLRRDDVRLVTLSGPGGSGKTRVGLRVTAELAHDFADGSYIVMLAAVRDALRVASTVAGVLNVQEAGTKPIDELLVNYLRERSVLLTLDNFEHVLAATPLVTSLLDHCPRLKILITSRAVLRVVAERDVLVPPLPVPPARASAAQALESPAVRLFAERARATGHAIGDDPANVAAAGDICRQLDGLPLALELAAARLRVLTPSALAQRLRSRLTLLKGGGADLPQRQRTLRGTIAWSYELLDADEQKLFARLAVFVGGWTLEAAEAITGADDLAQSVLDLLSSLIDHNLVQRTEDVADQARFTMLETVREFASELFEAGGEADALRARHADYFIEFAERADSRLRTGGRAPWLARFRVEYNNLRVALSWAVIERRDTTRALRLAGALPWYWYFTGQYGEGRGWIKLALALPGGDAPTAARAHVLSGEARLALYSAAIQEGTERAAESVELFRATGDRHGLAFALFHLGLGQSMARDAERSVATCEEAFEFFREVGDEWGATLALTMRGVTTLLRPGLEKEGRSILNESRACGQALDDDWLTTISSHYLGSVALRQGDYSTARALTEEMLVGARELGDNFRVSRNLYQLAEIAFAQGSIDEALRHLHASIAVTHEQGRVGDLVLMLRSMAAIEAIQSRPEHAVRLYGAVSRLDTQQTTIPSGELADHDKVRKELRAKLGDRAYDAEWARGTSMTLEQAVKLAMSSPHV